MLFPQNKLRPSSCGCLMRTIEGVFPQSAKAPAIADLTRPISDEYHGDVFRNNPAPPAVISVLIELGLSRLSRVSIRRQVPSGKLLGLPIQERNPK
jgi:hypothetical protein